MSERITQPEAVAHERSEVLSADPYVEVPTVVGEVVTQAAVSGELSMTKPKVDHPATEATAGHKQGKPLLSQPQIRRIYSPASGRDFILLPFDAPLMAPLHGYDDEPETEA